MSRDKLKNLNIQAPEGYRIVAMFLPTSAFKEVFNAIRITPLGETQVVLKRYRPLSSQQMQTIMKKFHFKDQSQMLEKDAIMYWAGPLMHPNIIPCDIIQNNLGEVFLVEPLLETTLDKQFPSSVVEFDRWLRGLLAGVQHLHANGYIHSDIKPDNMGLYYERAVLLDYGISTQFGEVQASRSNPGSIKTRPPELFGENVAPTRASDIWSLGASCYFMLTKGDYPFITKEEVANIPPAGSPSRHQFEEGIEKKVRLALTRPATFLDQVTKKMEDSKIIDKEVDDEYILVLRSCLILEPTRRQSSSQLIKWLNFWSQKVQ